MEIVPDTSVIIDGQISDGVDGGEITVRPPGSGSNPSEGFSAATGIEQYAIGPPRFGPLDDLE